RPRGAAATDGERDAEAAQAPAVHGDACAACSAEYALTDRRGRRQPGLDEDPLQIGGGTEPAAVCPPRAPEALPRLHERQRHRLGERVDALDDLALDAVRPRHDVRDGVARAERALRL